MLRPRWLATHVVLLGACALMILLGRWQWDVAASGGSGEGSLLNYGYALQWWAFAGFAVFIWSRLMRDERRRRAVAQGRLPASQGPDARRARAELPKPTPYRGYAMPQMAQMRQSDPDLIAYNEYLGALNPLPALPGTSKIDGPETAGEGER
jgi:DNA-binding transcriptional regulator of glucitol operon